MAPPPATARPRPLGTAPRPSPAAARRDDRRCGSFEPAPRRRPAPGRFRATGDVGLGRSWSSGACSRWWSGDALRHPGTGPLSAAPQSQLAAADGSSKAPGRSGRDRRATGGGGQAESQGWSHPVVQMADLPQDGRSPRHRRPDCPSAARRARCPRRRPSTPRRRPTVSPSILLGRRTRAMRLVLAAGLRGSGGPPGRRPGVLAPALCLAVHVGADPDGDGAGRPRWHLRPQR